MANELPEGQADNRSDAKRWLDAAWSDWIQPLGVLILAGAAYLLYKFDVVGERFAGVALVLVVVLGVLGVGAIPALGLAKRRGDKAMIAVMALLALGGAAWPTLHVALAPAPLATAHLTTAQPKVTVTTNADGPYEVIVTGQFKVAGASDVEASYAVKVEGTGSDTVTGDLVRSMHRYRTSRKGGTTASLEEHTEHAHRVDAVRGSQLTISTDGIDDQLDGALDVSVRSAGPRPEVFWALGALAILLALVLDVRLVKETAGTAAVVRGASKPSTYLTIVSAMLLVFSINFPMEATSRSLVRAGVGAFFLALILGGAGGWLVSSLFRLAGRPKRAR